MTTPLGSNLQVGFGRETADQQPSVGGITKFIRMKGVSGVHAKRPYERSASLDPEGQTVKGVNALATIARKYDFEPKADDVVWILSHLHGYHAAIVDLTGAYRWSIRPIETADSAPSYLSSFCSEISVDDSYPILAMGERFTDLDLSIAANKILGCSVSSMGCVDSYYDVANFSTDGGTYTSLPTLYGHPSSAASAYTIKAKCTTPGALNGTAKVKFTHDAIAYGATEYAVTAGVPIRVKDAAGARMGIDRFEDLWIVFPAGGTLSANDEFEFAAARTAATASYSTEDVLTAAGVEVTIGGTVYYFTGITAKIGRPHKAYQVAGTKYARTIQPNGRWAVSLSFDRDAEDRNLLLKLIRAEAFAVNIFMYGRAIGATAYDYMWKIACPNVQVTDDVRDVANENALPEKITCEAFRSGSSAIVTHTVENAIAALAT